MNYIPPDDQERFDYEVSREQWFEQQDKEYQLQEQDILDTMTLQDTLEAVEIAPKALHDEMWEAMRNTDICHMREVLWQMYKNYASVKAHDRVDRMIR